MLFTSIIKGLHALEIQPLEMATDSCGRYIPGLFSCIFVHIDIIFKTKMEAYSACCSVTCVSHLIIYCGLPCTSAHRDLVSGCTVFKYEYTIIYPVPLWVFPFFFFFFFWLHWVFVAAHRLFSSCSEREPLFIAVHRLLMAVASLFVEHGL